MIRAMNIQDYEEVFALWSGIKGFVIRPKEDSREGLTAFLKRNPGISAAAVENGKIVGTILCGHDGRRGSLYHVCVAQEYRNQGIGKAMVDFCMEALRAEKIHKVHLIAFTGNNLGNSFWKGIGFKKREDLYYYDTNLEIHG